MNGSRGPRLWTGMLVVTLAMSGLLFARPTASAAEVWVLGDPIYNDQGEIIGWFCAGDCGAGAQWCCKRIS